MGCDIHVFAEMRKDGIWHDVTTDPILPDDLFGSRNYRKFTLFAGVRDRDENVTPISWPRGLPEDVSPEVREELDWDYHSQSWLSLDELKNIPPAVRDMVGLGDEFDEDLACLERLGNSEDVRIVFAFDN